LTAALDHKPQSMAIAHMLTRVEIQQSHYQAAEKIAEKTAQLYPSDVETERLYLQALVLAGNTKIARPLAQKLLADAPQDFDLRYINGVLEHDSGDLPAARTHLEQAVAANPESFAARYNLGQVLGQLNDPEAAKDQLEKAIELGAPEPEVHLELAKALRALGETQAATDQLKLYQNGLKRQHDRALAASKTAQGDKALDAQDAQQAAAFYRDALEATPDDAQLNYKLAVALDLAGDLPAERTALEKAIQINPNLAVAQNQLGFLDSKSGDSAEAERHFREAVRAAPQFTEAWVNLAATLGLESRFPEAEQAVASALQLDPKNRQALLLRDTLAKALAQH
jgi:tetratricopeptide (TPR) repeat protein